MSDYDEYYSEEGIEEYSSRQSYEEPSYEKPEVKPFTKIEVHNFSKYRQDNIHHFTDTIEPAGSIPYKIFNGFAKACHTMYKFDSKTEKDFVIIPSIFRHKVASL